MAEIKKIVSAERPCYDDSYGVDEEGMHYRFLTNADNHRKEKIIAALKAYDGPVNVAFFDEARSFNEDTGASHIVSDSFAIYVANELDENGFHQNQTFHEALDTAF